MINDCVIFHSFFHLSHFPSRCSLFSFNTKKKRWKREREKNWKISQAKNACNVGMYTSVQSGRRAVWNGSSWEDKFSALMPFMLSSYILMGFYNTIKPRASLFFFVCCSRIWTLLLDISRNVLQQFLHDKKKNSRTILTLSLTLHTNTSICVSHAMHLSIPNWEIINY